MPTETEDTKRVAARVISAFDEVFEADPKLSADLELYLARALVLRHLSTSTASPGWAFTSMLLSVPIVDRLVDLTARAIEVLGDKERALRWLKTPVPALGDQTPLSLLGTEGGAERVEDVLGQIEQGVW